MYKKIFANFACGTAGIITGILLIILVLGLSFALVGGFTWVVLWIFGVSSAFAWSKVIWVWLILLAWNIITGTKVEKS